MVSWFSSTHTSRFALHSEITLATSPAVFTVQRPPLSTTRTLLAPAALMLAKLLVWFGYQACGWLIPRSTTSLPVAS